MLEVIKNTEDLLKFHEECSARGRELMRAKNHDYSGVEDVFRNFRAWEELGILVRAGDKLARMKSFEERKTLAVKDESITDTAIDLMNYAILYLGYKRCALTKRQRTPDADQPGSNPNIPRNCNACGKILLMENLYVDDGCPCNSPRGVNFKPQTCFVCAVDDCVKPGHRLKELYG